MASILPSQKNELYLLLYKLLLLCFSIFSIYFIIQLDITLNLLKEGVDGLSLILIGQSYNLGIAIIVSLIFIPFNAYESGRKYYQIFIAAFIIYLIADRHFYALMFDHIQGGYLEGDANAVLMKDSILSLINYMSFFYVFLGVIWLIWIHRIINIQTTRPFIERCIKNKFLVSISLIVLFIYS